jgi:hypothetical protein
MHQMKFLKLIKMLHLQNFVVTDEDNSEADTNVAFAKVGREVTQTTFFYLYISY